MNSKNLLSDLDENTKSLCNQILKAFVKEENIPNAKPRIIQKSLSEIANTLDSTTNFKSFASAIELLENRGLIMEYPHKDKNELHKYMVNLQAYDYVHSIYGPKST